jgi:peptide/nickel transport system permease protein
MTRFVLSRLTAAVPTVVGITLVTFVLLNVTLDRPLPGDLPSGPVLSVLERQSADDLARVHGLHLPLFINLDIADVEVHTEKAIERFADERNAAAAARGLARLGGAVLPYLVPAIPEMEPPVREHALDALDQIASQIDLSAALEAAANRSAFWARYWDTYGSDFVPARAARLVRRLLRRDDQLARSELLRLHTYCLPALMDALDDAEDPLAQARLVGLAAQLVEVDDRLDPQVPPAMRQATLERWREWWNQHYDQYTVFSGFRRMTGAITETRYVRWLARIATFDFGVSIRDGRSIRDKLAERLPVTLLLAVLALLTAYALAIPLGTVTAVRSGGPFDRAMTVALFVLYSLPAFWVAMLVLRYLSGSGYLDLFPAQGLVTPGAENWPLWRQLLDRAHHLVLPVFCLSYVSMAMLTRYQRVGMLEVIHRNYMRTARAKGLSRSAAILRHGLRNGMIPIVTMLGLQLPYLVSGSVVVEYIFGIPGMGLETFEAVGAQDNAWLIAVVTVTAAFTTVGMIAADVIYALVDPRIAPGRGLGGVR